MTALCESKTKEIFMSKVWLVTGSGSGLGRNITEAVLASGDRLVATARDPRRLDDVVKKYGDQVRTASLDVADENAANSAVQAAVDAFGRLDVVVNNAGYGDIAPFEQLSSERFKSVVDTNFYGVVNVTRAALPIMRKQKSGCILQISSVGGRLARQHAVSRRQMGSRGIYRIPCPGGGSVRRTSVRARTWWNADKLGRPRQ
jgi:NAD(P)-dependent dehydrogenase (short-subunit alcohol dehydrogenase family)